MMRPRAETRPSRMNLSRNAICPASSGIRRPSHAGRARACRRPSLLAKSSARPFLTNGLRADSYFPAGHMVKLYQALHRVTSTGGPSMSMSSTCGLLRKTSKNLRSTTSLMRIAAALGQRSEARRHDQQIADAPHRARDDDVPPARPSVPRVPPREADVAPAEQEKTGRRQRRARRAPTERADHAASEGSAGDARTRRSTRALWTRSPVQHAVAQARRAMEADELDEVRGDRARRSRARTARATSPARSRSGPRSSTSPQAARAWQSSRISRVMSSRSPSIL